jgi:carbon storage regulator
MLVLSRQRDETIMIGDDIEITVVDIRGDKVRLGINAPSRVAVHRKEVYEAIRKENEQAARAVGNELPALRRPIAPGGKLTPERVRAVRPSGTPPDSGGSGGAGGAGGSGGPTLEAPAPLSGLIHDAYPLGLPAKRKHA